MEAPCTGESPPLHVKNPLHYSYKSRPRGNPGVMVHLHTPIRPSIRHLQESSVLKEADYLEEEEDPTQLRGLTNVRDRKFGL